MQRIVVNLDASGIVCSILWVIMMAACLVEQEISLTWSGQLYIIASRIILGCSCEGSRSTADCAVYFPIQPLQSLCSQCTPTNSRLFFIYLFKILPFISTWPSPYGFLFYSVMSLLLGLHKLLHLSIARN